MDRHRLIYGDASGRDAIIAEDTVDLIVTSPPYNIGMAYSDDATDDKLPYNNYFKFTSKWLSNCYKWARPVSRMCVNICIDNGREKDAPYYADFVTVARRVGWRYHTTITWSKSNVSRLTAWGSWKSASAPYISTPIEVVILFFKGSWGKPYKGTDDITAGEFKHWVRGDWSFSGESAKRIGHPAPFPRELPRRCVKLLSYVGETVLDPFVGSGTTMIEAINSRRVAIGIEKELQWVDLAEERLLKECGKMWKVKQ